MKSGFTPQSLAIEWWDWPAIQLWDQIARDYANEQNKIHQQRM
jgi:hypothetical protein